MAKSKQAIDEIPDQLLTSIQNIVRTVGFGKNINGKAPTITVTQMRVLSVFSDKPVIHISEVSPILGMSVPSINNIVSRLETSGHVKRKKNKDNRRFTDISLTEKGKKSICAFRDDGIKELTRLLDKLNKKDVQELHATLTRAAEILGSAR
ncbi:MAG: winged helix-turn-helix transcriptional regulator [Proteobacteria bacterium]|nr:winged helix-turn-helix transcriptional regulator [Pseudomonadota bacterium]